jgi:preprotein translocase subunit SecF
MKPFNVFPYDSKIDFMRLRMISMAVAALIMFAAIGGMVFKGFNFALEAAGFDNAQVQTFGTGKELLVRLRDDSATKKSPEDKASSLAESVRVAASEQGNPARMMRSSEISAQVGKELAWDGLLALVFVVVGFLIYISMRFELKFAVAAIITTLHDVVVVIGWFALSGHEFDLTVLAGILSVMGFSINDTIVVFDRVRENFRGMRAEPYEVLNRSINQTLSRTVITSFVAFLTVFALYLYGGGSLQGMAESQMIGIIIGTLSSIFVACPLLMWLGVSKQDLMPKAKDDEALARRP